MIISVEQGSQEWIDLRRTKVTATDAASITGCNPWVSREMLMARKKGIIEDEPLNDAMKRGQELEPIARAIYEERSGHKMKPTVRVGQAVEIEDGSTWYNYNWAMCSTDGESERPLKDGRHFCIEIKSGKKAYLQACQDFIPDYYLCQIQHILWLTDCAFCHYCAFDGDKDLKIIKVWPNLQFIADMINKEYEFYKELMSENSID